MATNNTTGTQDEEIAKALQEKFLAEIQNEANTHSTGIQADILLAQQLQAQFDNEAKQPSPPPPSSVPPHTFHLHSHHREKLEPNSAPPTPQCIKRIRSDLAAFVKHPNPSIHVAPHEDDVTHIEALIIGPDDTPYEGGFFHFDMRFPHDYPWNPPKVLLQTTDNGAVRFNPNLYAEGKVCLSILGTWQGPGWKAVQTLETVLISVQSLMNPTPYQNEPGYEKERRPGDIKNYNECILHETLRVAVCGMMESPTCGEVFRPIMNQAFLQRYEKYVKMVTDRLPMEGKPMRDPFGSARGNFRYKDILARLEAIKKSLTDQVTTTTTTTSS
jgi:ubiquitin-conjugating enzyme E2 Z